MALFLHYDNTNIFFYSVLVCGNLFNNYRDIIIIIYCYKLSIDLLMTKNLISCFCIVAMKYIFFTVYAGLWKVG